MTQLNAVDLAKELGISFDVVLKRRRQGKWPCVNPETRYGALFDLDVCRALFQDETNKLKERKKRLRAAYKERERLRKLKWIADRNAKRLIKPDVN